MRVEAVTFEKNEAMKRLREVGTLCTLSHDMWQGVRCLSEGAAKQTGEGKLGG